MGMIGKLLEFVIGDQSATSKVDTGGGFNLTEPHFQPSGDDAHPLPDDAVYGGSTRRSGQHAALGYQDAFSAPKAALGEKRIYARKADGTVIAEIWLKNTGEMTIINDNIIITVSEDGGFKVDNDDGCFELMPDGTFKIQDIEFDPSNNVQNIQTLMAEILQSTKSMTVNSIEVHAHTHTSALPGSPTGIMITGTPAP